MYHTGKVEPSFDNFAQKRHNKKVYTVSKSLRKKFFSKKLQERVRKIFRPVSEHNYQNLVPPFPEKE